MYAMPWPGNVWPYNIYALNKEFISYKWVKERRKSAQWFPRYAYLPSPGGGGTCISVTTGWILIKTADYCTYIMAQSRAYFYAQYYEEMTKESC